MNGDAVLCNSFGFHLQVIYNKGIKLRSALTQTITKRCMKFFNEDPYGSVSNKDQIKKWVKNDKRKEIQNLET